MANRRVLVTGFGPFGSFETNPSSILAEKSGLPHEILEVSYAGVTEWLDRLDTDQFDDLLLIGVHGGAERMHIERYGHNCIGKHRDVRGYMPPRRRIRPGAPWRLPATLWRNGLDDRGFIRNSEWFGRSANAGSFLCNFVFYEALTRFPDKKVGFLHVPSFEKMPCATQIAALREVIDRLAS